MTLYHRPWNYYRSYAPEMSPPECTGINFTPLPINQTSGTERETRANHTNKFSLWVSHQVLVSMDPLEVEYAIR